MVVGLIATVALPAYGAWRTPAQAAVTLQQVAADDAQSLVVASDATSEELDRGGYSATTAEEIEKKKAEEAAAARAREAAAAAAAAAATGPSSSVAYSMNLSMTAPGSGEVRWPVSNFTYSSINLFRPPNRPNHNGFDMLAPAGTPDLRRRERRGPRSRRRATPATASPSRSIRSSAASRSRRSTVT